MVGAENREKTLVSRAAKSNKEREVQETSKDVNICAIARQFDSDKACYF